MVNIRKIIILLIVNLFLNTISAKNAFTSIQIDTVKVEITPTAFITNDTIFQCYILKDEGLFFIDKKQLNDFIAHESQKTYNKNGHSFRKSFKVKTKKDTLRTVLNTNPKYTADYKYIKNQFNIPLLWYDLKSAYLFDLFDETYSDKFLYLACINKVTRSDFEYYQDKFYTLIKVDLTQNSGYNFYFFTKSSSKNSNVTLIDSTTISSKKHDKIRSNVQSISIDKDDSQQTRSSNEGNYFLFVKGNKYLLQKNYKPLNKEGIYTIGLLKKYARKNFDLPYYKKKK